MSLPTQKYTLTVWIDFEADTLEEAQDTAAELKRACIQAVDSAPVTEIETELAPTPEQGAR